MTSNFPLEGRDLFTVTDIEYIHAAKNGPVLFKKGTKIVRNTSTAVLKISMEILPQEAANMTYIAEHSNEQIRVPRVYRTFTSGYTDYITVEFIDGECLDAKPWLERSVEQRRSIVLQVSESLRCMRTMRSLQPGPAGQGIPLGGLFTLYNAGMTFQTAADMEPWFNDKLRLIGGGDITGMFKDLVMCHMDISLRNLILDKAGKLWIIDWTWAGFFPQEFEIASLLHKRPEALDFQFSQDVFHEIRHANDDETLLNLLLKVYQVNDGPFMASHIVQPPQSVN